MKSKRTTAPSPFSMQPLESRLFLAGHLTAIVNGDGLLTITGDKEANDFTLTKTGTTGNQIKITGLNGTTVNKNKTQLTVKGFTDSLHIITGAGNDSVRLDNSTLPGGLSIETGDGNDQISLDTVNVSGRLFVSTGAGNDQLTTKAGTVGITTEIHMGAGDDIVDLTGTTFTFRFSAKLGAGNDIFLPGDATFKREQRFVDGEGGNDRIFDDANDEELENFNFNFANGSRGWNPGISDYLRKDQDNLEKKEEIRALDQALGSGTGFYLSSKNLSDDVFQFVKRQVTDLKKNTNYTVRFEVTFGSNTPSGALAVGGLPGDEVFLKVGGATNEPQSFTDKKGRVRFNLDKGANNKSGKNMTVVSTTANGNSAGTGGYKSVTKTAYHNVPIKSDSQGRLWLVAGFDSMFNGTTAIYIQSINVRLLPQT
jgi:hypothetical protein